jgi:hypothetical protein
VNDRELWIQVRRGMLKIADAIENDMDRAELRRGLFIVTSAIEYRYALPHVRSSAMASPRAGATPQYEPPSETHARSSTERVG